MFWTGDQKIGGLFWTWSLPVLQAAAPGFGFPILASVIPRSRNHNLEAVWRDDAYLCARKKPCIHSKWAAACLTLPSWKNSACFLEHSGSISEHSWNGNICLRAVLCLCHTSKTLTPFICCYSPWAGGSQCAKFFILSPKFGCMGW